MGDPVSVSVGWALWGKQPGAVREYSLLASSAQPLDEAEFANVLTHFMPGTPSAEPGSARTNPAAPDPPGSLPWVTFSRVGVAKRVYLGISIQDSTGTQDGVGRPITSTSYFCIPYDELQGALFSYVDLYKQLAELKLPYHGDDPIRLTVPTLEAEQIAKMIEDFGEPTVRAAAAMLLSGQVSIVGSEGTALYDRLRFLDAVAALLPYGYRAGYTASTWSDSGKRHPIRLAFAARPRQDAGAIRWRSAPTAPLGGAGEAYLRRLQQIRERLSEPSHLVRLIEVLERDKEICGFDQPQRAMDGLYRFGLPYIVLDAVRKGTAKPEEIRAVFAQSRADDLTPGERQELLAGLICIAGQDPQNWEVIDGQWDRVVGGEPLTMLSALVKGSQRLLWARAPDRLTCQRYINCAARHGIIDDLLAQLIAAPVSRPDLLGGRQTAAQLIADYMPTGPGASPLRQTGVALASKPLVACELLTHLAIAGQRLDPALTWLEPSLGGLLAPFSALVGHPPGEVSEQAIGQLADSDTECVSALLVAADCLGRVDRVLPGLAIWLARSVLARGQLDPDQDRSWYGPIMDVRQHTTDSAAWLDLVLLISRNPLRFLLTPIKDRDRKPYVDSITRGWEILGRSLGRAGDDLLTRNLTDYLRHSWRADDAGVAVVVTDLVKRLAGDGQRPGLRAAVSEALGRSPEAARWRLAQEWLPPARKPQPPARQQQPPAAREQKSPRQEQEQPQPDPWDVRRSPADAPSLSQSSLPPGADHPALTALRALPPDATAVHVAGLLANAYRENLGLQDVGRALGDSKAINSGAYAMAVLEELRSALLAAPGKRSAAEEWLGNFANWFADGSFGAQTADEFSRFAVQSSVDEIHYYTRILRIVTVRNQEHATLGARDTEILSKVRKLLDQILPDSKKLPGIIQSVLRQGRQGAEGTSHGER